ncbi:MAG: hypothetical protein J1E33_02525, partial [Alistipes sp.]|nr:hypothetical protein [Alistipes sp.]
TGRRPKSERVRRPALSFAILNPAEDGSKFDTHHGSHNDNRGLFEMLHPADDKARDMTFRALPSLSKDSVADNFV